MQHIEFERLAQAIRGKVAGGIVPAGDAGEQARQHGEFAGKQRFQHPGLGFPQHRREFWRLVADLAPDLVKRLETGTIDQRPGNHVHPFIAGGAVNADKSVQPFVLAEDLFDHHVERSRRAALRVSDQAAQALEILHGIAQTVDVIEPQALQLALGD